MRGLFWDDKVIAGDEVHGWFRVNALFWDPNILGRYLAITLIALAVVVAWSRQALTALVATGVAFVLLVALALTFSQSSLVALLAGLAVVVALRWSVRWSAVALAALAAAGAIAILAGASGTDFGSDSIEAETSGRAGLISGGIDLAGDRPLFGYGSGAFEVTFRDQFGAWGGEFSVLIGNISRWPGVVRVPRPGAMSEYGMTSKHSKSKASFSKFSSSSNHSTLTRTAGAMPAWPSSVNTSSSPGFEAGGKKFVACASGNLAYSVPSKT